MNRRLVLAVALAALVAAGSSSFSGATFTSSSRNTANRATSARDWTAPTVVLADPGTLLTRTLTLSATATDDRSAIASVGFELAAANTAGWVRLCTVATAPYGCALDTSAFADGLYDLRATTVDVEGNAATSAVLTARTFDNTAPTAMLVDPGDFVRGTITLSAAGADAGSGVASVRIQRSLSDADSWTDVCTVTSASASCPLVTTSLANDYHDLRVIVTDRVGNVSAPFVVIDVLVDNVAPTVTMTNPGSPLRGTVTLGATPADGGSGVGSVTIQYAPTGTSGWANACATTTSPWTCRFDTTKVADGGYDFRTVAYDAAGNGTISATVTNRLVDNTQSSISMEDPGAYLIGTVQLVSSPYSNAAITSVRIQRAVNGSNTWTDVCTVTVAPYSCSWNTLTVADGLYDFRAVLLDGAAKTTTSAVVSVRRVDNSPLRGTDVQTTNGGSTVGKVEAGDTIRFTYSKVVRANTLIAGWDGTSTAAVVRVRDGNLASLSSVDDQLDVWTSTTLKTPVNLGSVNLKGDFVKGSKTAVFHATIALQTVTVNGTQVSRAVITIGTLASGSGVRTSGSTAHMVWTPSSAVLDIAGNAASTSPVSETGLLDKDF